jgi:hypothetical protein
MQMGNQVEFKTKIIWHPNASPLNFFGNQFQFKEEQIQK